MPDRPPIDVLGTRRKAKQPELERRVKQAMRGAAVSERMLVAADNKLRERGSEGRYGLTAEDLKAAIKAALMEYGK